MKYVATNFKAFILSLTVLFCTAWGGGVVSAQEAPDYIKGELLVTLKKGHSIEQVLNKEALKNSGIRIEKHLPNLGIWKLSFPEVPGFDTRARLALFKGFSEIQAAQLNHKVELRSRSTTPNDEYYGDQWALNNTGQTGGTSGADISAEGAWNLTTSNTTANGDEIVIAVIDNFFDLDHEDLNFWKNEEEIPGNDHDDDGNGYVDDYDGWNAYDDNGDFPDAEEYDFHGTHVTGIAAAKGNNNTGISGVAPNTKVLPVMGSSPYESTVWSAYEYIITLRKQYENTNGQEGAFIPVTNSSFGLDYANPANHPIWCAAYDSLGEYGIVNVSSVSNNDYDVDTGGGVPDTCSSDYLITVANTDHNDALSDTSAYGATHVDLGAPGSMIVSSVPINPNPPPSWGETQYNNKYGRDTGTSYAAPHVTGTVALMFSYMSTTQLQLYENDPAGMMLQVKDWILDSVDPVPDLSGITVSEGRLNAYKALQVMFDPPPSAPTNLVVVNEGSGGGQMQLAPAELDWDDNTEADLDFYKVYRKWQGEQNWTMIGQPSVSTFTDQETSINDVDGDPVSYYVTAVDDLGQESGASNTETVTADDLFMKVMPRSEEPARPKEFTLSSNYPNPFNPVTTVEYALPEQADVQLFVYNLLGRRVAVLVDRNQPAGQYRASFDAAGLSSGWYFARLQAIGESGKEFKQDITMQLVK
ncbi:S8 family serine peptidase [Gracilimonas sp. Q87]|uniref:S8 family serine peptidase n=1 Tax=Gracilimonas sp. Q87 TaxID=3384766 RepID=UPI003983E2A4